VAGALDAALAQGGPFGAPRAQAPAPPMGGVLGWIFAKQAEFYRQFSSLIRAAKADGSVAWGLFGLSFLYGVFHAAGPGHGKAVISSYMVANEETWVRGVVLSFASALLQALVAVVLVGIAAALLNATAATMKRAVDLIEILSYSLIILIGVRLLWVKGWVFLTTLRTLHRPAAVGAAVTPAYSLHGHGHHDHQHDHAHDHALAHAHDHGHAHADSVIPYHTPSLIMPMRPHLRARGPVGWKRGLSAIVAMGHAVFGRHIVLVFALAQGLFWAGVARPSLSGRHRHYHQPYALAVGPRPGQRFAESDPATECWRCGASRSRGGRDHRLRRSAPGLAPGAADRSESASICARGRRPVMA
jgi:nickel/cobalt exporter